MRDPSPFVRRHSRLPNHPSLPRSSQSFRLSPRSHPQDRSLPAGSAEQPRRFRPWGDESHGGKIRSPPWEPQTACSFAEIRRRPRLPFRTAAGRGDKVRAWLPRIPKRMHTPTPLDEPGASTSPVWPFPWVAPIPPLQAARHREWVDLAESLGLHSVWLPEMHFAAGRLRGPAGRNRRFRRGDPKVALRNDVPAAAPASAGGDRGRDRRPRSALWRTLVDRTRPGLQQEDAGGLRCARSREARSLRRGPRPALRTLGRGQREAQRLRDGPTTPPAAGGRRLRTQGARPGGATRPPLPGFARGNPRPDRRQPGPTSDPAGRHPPARALARDANGLRLRGRRGSARTSRMRFGPGDEWPTTSACRRPFSKALESPLEERAVIGSADGGHAVA